jgi:hypothetical protein
VPARRHHVRRRSGLVPDVRLLRRAGPEGGRHSAPGRRAGHARLAELAALHKPRLYVVNSVLHNPSSTSLSAAKAFQVLRIAEEHDFTIVEDDIPKKKPLASKQK